MDDRDDASEPPSSAEPGAMPEDDFDADAEMARWVADLEAGRERIPEEWELDGSGISLSLGDACDLDPALLAAMLGPNGLGGETLNPAFAQDRAADALRPGPVLAALTEQAVSNRATLSDDELTGALHATRRLKNRAAYLETLEVAEFGRRRAAAYEDAKARGVRPGRRPGEFAADELSGELVVTLNHADALMECDAALTSRLPMTLAGMAAGAISEDRADAIAAWTASLSDADAARADEILAAAAPGLRRDQLARKAAALEMKLNPEGVKARKEHAKATRQRVEVRREDSGNASIAGRELDTVVVLGCKSYIDALAVRIRNHGHADGGLDAIRTHVMTELLQGRNPLNLLKPRPKLTPNPDAAPAVGETPDDDGGGPGNDDARTDGSARADGAEAGPSGGAGTPDPDDPGPDYPGDLDDADDDYDCGDPLPGYAGPDGAPAWSPEEAENARHIEPDDPAERRGPLRPAQSAPPPGQPQPHHPHRDPPRLVHHPRPSRILRPPGPRRNPRPRRRRVPPSENPLVRHPHRPGRPGDRPRPRPRTAPLGSVTPRAPPGTSPPRTSPPDRATGPQPPHAADPRTTRRRPGRPAPPPHPGAQYHLRPHRPGHLRPPAGREPLHPQPQTQGPDPRPHGHLRRPRLRRPGHLLPTSTTPCRTPTARPTSATSAPNAGATTAPSRHPAGMSSSQSPASSAGRSPTGAATPQHPPRTTADVRSAALLSTGAMTDADIR